jgi:HK97 gp10 family phage protein
MGLKASGFNDFNNDLEALINGLSPESIKKALQAGAEPVLRQQKANVKSVSGDLDASLTIGKVKKNKSGSDSITIGAHKGSPAQEYVGPLEYGHGGPHPAPPHPFMRPAFDATVDEAYAIVRDTLKNESTKG